MDDSGTHGSDLPHPEFDLDRLASGRATPAERQAAVRHLMAGCRRCGERLVRWLGPEPAEDREMAAAVRRAIGGVSGLAAWVAAEKDSAEDFVGRLRSLPAAHQRLLVTNSDRACTRAVVERLLEESRSSIGASPRAAAQFADLALLAAERCEGPESHELRVRALGVRANARRNLGDFVAAAADFAAADRLLADSPVADPLVGAELLSFKASLASDQRRFGEAVGLLRRAAARYRRLGDPRGVARILVQIGYVATCSGEPGTGIEPLRTALELLADLDEPRLRLQAAHNLVLVTLEAGDPQEASRLLVRLRPLYASGGRRLDRLRFDWLAARVDLALDRPERAAALLAALRVRYAQEDLVYDAVLVSLDLAVAWHRAGRRERVAELAAETAAQFAHLGIAREHIAALGLLAGAEAEHAVRLVAGLAAAVDRRRREAPAP